jgi:hypothetical protein
LQETHTVPSRSSEINFLSFSWMVNDRENGDSLGLKNALELPYGFIDRAFKEPHTRGHLDNT